MTDLINRPPHYITASGIEAIEVIEQYGLGFHLGSAMQYLLRAGRKGDALADMRKAAWYLARWIDLAPTTHGFEYPSASDDVDGGLGWHTPEAIADAFDLTGGLREAVIYILKYAAMSREFFEFEESGEDVGDRTMRALDYVRAEIEREAAP